MGLLKRDERTSTRCVGDSGLGPSSMYRHSCGWALGVRGPGEMSAQERGSGAGKQGQEVSSLTEKSGLLIWEQREHVCVCVCVCVCEGNIGDFS